MIRPAGIRTCERCGTEMAAVLPGCPACGTVAVAAAAAAPVAPTAAAAPTSTAPTPAAERPAAPQHPLKRAWAALVTGTLLILSKIKLLLLGLTKLSTFSSMLLFLGVYWSLWGWQFALGFVVCIYIHEMGHVAALARYGISASPPMFIPGLGAFVRLKQSPADVHQDARVGLAGPIWGLAAGAGAYAIGLATHAPIWMGIARSAGFLNLFNLIPIWQLDGGRGFRALSRTQRWIAVAVLAIAYGLTSEGLLVILAVGAVYRAFGKDAPAEDDWPVLATFIGLIAALAPMAKIAVPGITR